MMDPPTHHSASLDMCRRLQKLSADKNLIINSTVKPTVPVNNSDTSHHLIPSPPFPVQGLQDHPSLQEVSLAENHLPKLSGVESCVLLQTLNLRQNNIQEVCEGRGIEGRGSERRGSEGRGVRGGGVKGGV